MSAEEEKYTLRKNTIKYKKALEEELDKWFGSAKSTTKNILIIGGTITVSYLLAKKLTKLTKRKKKKKTANQAVPSEHNSRTSLFDEISDQLLRELSIFILTYTRQKILEYIETLKENDEQHS